MKTFYRVSTGTEAASYTWQIRSDRRELRHRGGHLAGKGAVGGITAYAGVDVANAGGPILSLTGANANAATVNAPAVAGVAANTIVVRRFGNNGSSTVVPAATSSTGVANTPGLRHRATRGRSRRVRARLRRMPTSRRPAAPARSRRPMAAPAAAGWPRRSCCGCSAPCPSSSSRSRDTTAQLGTNLTPTGVASNSTDGVAVNIDPTVPSAGACYEWDGSVTVRSTTTYNVMVAAAAANARLDFLTADPSDLRGVHRRRTRGDGDVHRRPPHRAPG